MNSPAQADKKTATKKMNAKDRYRILSRDLDWDFSYVDRKDAFPYEEFEGIKITDWSKWEDPFRLTMDSYWKYQAEKEKKLYAIFDAFSQNNGQLKSGMPTVLAITPSLINHSLTLIYVAVFSQITMVNIWHKALCQWVMAVHLKALPKPY